ncbi:MAG: oligopeptide/dipeptide transporter, ATPase subunit [Chloroflexi bacterium]|nr:oligopeptide/dipeptide transporter, ATPase subunit [Chloroflexota bacterium]
MPLLEVDGLEVQFFTPRGVVKAVDGVSFKLEKGQTLGIVGETGSGKSVTAFSILRLVSNPGRITGGSIRFEGQDLLTMRDRDVRRIRGREISMVFQEVMTSLNPSYTVGEQMREVLRVHLGQSGQQARKSALDLLTRVRVPGPETILDRYPHQLSGGMRQRVMIGIAIACQPKLLIADEPTTALDTTIQAQILDLLEDMRQQLGMAMIFISHDLGVVARVSERIAVMYAGRIVEMGDKYEVFDSSLHPYTIGLMDAIPRPGSRHKPLQPIRGAIPNLLHLPSGCPFHTRCPRAEARCAVETPELLQWKTAHWAACHFAGDLRSVVAPLADPVT